MQKNVSEGVKCIEENIFLKKIRREKNVELMGMTS